MDRNQVRVKLIDAIRFDAAALGFLRGSEALVDCRTATALILGGMAVRAEVTTA